jgi:hypothetical protein
MKDANARLLVRENPHLNGMDFQRIERLANQSHGVTFDTVLRRAMKGVTDETELMRPTILPPSENWITPDDCRRILRVGAGVWAGAIARHPTAIYWGIRAKTRSTLVKLDKNGKGARGCGALFYKPDIERLAQIKHEAHLSFATALKVFFAMSEGRL